MKKLITVMMLMVLSVSLMASEPINLTKKETEHVDAEFKLERSVTNGEKDWIERSWLGTTVRYEKLSNGKFRESWKGDYVKIEEHDITINTATHLYKNAGGVTGLTYTVTNTQKYNTQKDDLGVSYERDRAQIYFTTTTDIPEDKVLAVQFLGAEIEEGNSGAGYDPQFKVKDYGIYLYDPETGEKGEWLSVKESNNYFSEGVGIKAGTSFGVYFVDKDGNYITTTDNVVGNFDDDKHQLKTYDKDGNIVYQTTDKHFLCMFTNTFESGKLNQTHWEFMLQTTLDNPYFPVNPNDFGTDVHIDNPVVNGQPLPGTMATLLIGGFCAASLRKKKKS